MRNHAIRHLRRKAVKLVKSNNLELRVVGSEKAGFNLAVELNDQVVRFSQSFDKQTQAIGVGNAVFGQKARKLLLTRRESVAA